MVSHTPGSRLLRTDHPQSLRPVVRMFGLPFNQGAYGFLEHSLRTGRPAVEKVFGEAMTAKAHGHVASILGAYDFSDFHVIGDIGGGHGHLLRAVLERVPTARGVLFDLPNVLREVADLASERLVLQPEDFFSDPLPVCDAYLLMEVIHD